jgi:hypothetical protein
MPLLKSTSGIGSASTVVLGGLSLGVLFFIGSALLTRGEARADDPDGITAFGVEHHYKLAGGGAPIDTQRSSSTEWS